MLIIAPLLAAALAFQPQPAPTPAQTPAAKPSEPATKTVTLRVLDQEGHPVRGVLVGGNMWATSQRAPDLEPHLVFTGHLQLDALETDAKGEVTVDQNALFYGDDDAAPKPAIAWSKDHTHIGMAEVPRPCPPPHTPIDIKLAPACHLTIKTTSKGLEDLGRTLTWSNVYLIWNKMRPMSSDSRSGEQTFYVPPGQYKLNAYGADADSVYPDLTIAPGETTKTVTLDLPASRIAQLTGKPAPEFTHIQGWLNGGPVKLADLKGKVVLLDFWGYWCGPCVHAMPELIELHEKYKDKGLIIIAVHDASVPSIAEMQARLERPKKEIWGGKDLPFLVALDGPDQPLAKDDKPYGSGATTAAYGITAFPTQVLIDKDGHVVGRASKGQVERMMRELQSK